MKKRFSEENLRQNIVLTEDAVEWVRRRGNPVCATDFIGYLFDIRLLYRELKKIGAAVDVFGGFRIFSLDEKYPHLKDKKALKIYKKLIKMGFLKFDDDEPFAEYSLSRNIQIDSNKVNIVEQPIFLSTPQDVVVGYGNGVYCDNQPIDIGDVNN